jgi:hypothetical protein
VSGQAGAQENVQGTQWPLATEEELRTGLAKAFNNRGGVKITRRDRSCVEGCIFDRRTRKTLADAVVRLLPKDGRGKIAMAYADIAALAFTGRDTAAGKNWEAWMKKYWEKKAAGGKRIELKPETLE